MKRLRVTIGACFFASILILLHPIAYAQNGTGTITGTVSDPTGSVVSGGVVVVIETQTGIKHQTVSNASGAYTIPMLPVGIYNISAIKPGYSVAAQKGLKLNTPMWRALT